MSKKSPNVTKQMSEPKHNKKKTVIIVSAAILTVLVLTAAVCFAVWFFSDEPDDTQEEIFYYPEDFSDNILDSQVYLDLDRDLYFGDQGLVISYSSENYESASDECRMFYDYFTAVEAGDQKTYSSFFFSDENMVKNSFTMQMIYDRNVTFHSSSAEEIDGEEIEIENYFVSYKIHWNNGSFRRGVRSDAAVPQIYQLVRDASGDYKIFRILDIKHST